MTPIQQLETTRRTQMLEVLASRTQQLERFPARSTQGKMTALQLIRLIKEQRQKLEAADLGSQEAAETLETAGHTLEALSFQTLSGATQHLAPPGQVDERGVPAENKAPLSETLRDDLYDLGLTLLIEDRPLLWPLGVAPGKLLVSCGALNLSFEISDVAPFCSALRYRSIYRHRNGSISEVEGQARNEYSELRLDPSDEGSAVIEISGRSELMGRQTLTHSFLLELNPEERELLALRFELAAAQAEQMILAFEQLNREAQQAAGQSGQQPQRDPNELN